MTSSASAEHPAPAAGRSPDPVTASVHLAAVARIPGAFASFLSACASAARELRAALAAGPARRASCAAVKVTDQAARHLPQQAPGTCHSSTGRLPRVFICYAHDDEEHVESVRALAGLLVQCRLDVHLDRWGLEQRRDWYLWAGSQLDLADYVVIVASPVCRRVGDGKMENTRHQGLQSEMAQLRELLHSDRAAWTRKLLPVVLPGRSVSDIPLFLQPRTADHYIVAELTLAGVEDLIMVITQLPLYQRPPLSGPPALPQAIAINPQQDGC